MDRIPGAEALAAQNILAAILSYKLKQEFSEMCGFIRARISLAIMRSNRLLLRILQDKGEIICQQPDLTDGGVMVLLVPG